MNYSYHFGPFVLDPSNRELWRDCIPIPLGSKAFDVLLYLAQNPNRIIGKDELLQAVWADKFVEEGNLTQAIFLLRKALAEDADENAKIVTVPRKGYQFAASVAVAAGDAPARAGAVGTLAAEDLAPASRVGGEEGLERDVAATPKAPAFPLMRGKARLVAPLAIAAVAAGTVAVLLLLAPAPVPRVLRSTQLTHSGRVQPHSTVYCDGSRIYFTERLGGTGTLAEAPVEGGETTLVTTSVSSLTVLDLDASQSRLFIGTQSAETHNPLWVVPTTGGSGRRVGEVLVSDAAAWSPTRRSIYYGRGAEIYRVGDDGREPVRLLTAPGTAISLRVAPDGKLLRFTVRDRVSGATSLWESSTDGSNPHPLALGKTTARQWGEGESCGDWSPDGRYFAFRAVSEGVESLWAIREKRAWLQKDSGPVQLHTSPDHLSEPRFSPDGKRIFFVGSQKRTELVRYDAELKLFVPYLGGIPARLVNFSRDGQWVAYRNETDGCLWRSRTDGTKKLQLSFSPLAAFHPAWSPDGKRIVFEGRLPGARATLYSIPSDGGNPELLTSGDTYDTGPSWSCDGRPILFQRWTYDETGTLHSAVYELDLKTLETRIVPGSNDFDGVHWSPDGKYAAASDQANRKLVLLDFARKQWSVLADGPPHGWGIRWSSDSRYVYYQNTDEAEEQPIFRVRVSDRAVERITSARQILRADVLSYTMTGLTPDNSPLASLTRKESDVYALELELP